MKHHSARGSCSPGPFRITSGNEMAAGTREQLVQEIQLVFDEVERRGMDLWGLIERIAEEVGVAPTTVLRWKKIRTAPRGKNDQTQTAAVLARIRKEFDI